MTKYLRIPADLITHDVPRHRFVGYIHGLDSTKPITLEEYLDVWKRQEEEFGYAEWTKVKINEALEGLQWLVDNGLATMVE